jgi:hypothetical protein
MRHMPLNVFNFSKKPFWNYVDIPVYVLYIKSMFTYTVAFNLYVSTFALILLKCYHRGGEFMLTVLARP